MPTIIISIALLSFLSHSIIPTTAQQNFIHHLCYNNVGNYTNTSTYSTNLNTLLSNLTSDAKIDYGYYSSSEGQNPNDRVNALGLCRGDVKPDSCRSCLNNATVLLRKLCPNQKEAYGYNDGCILRYANRSMAGINQDSDYSFYMCNPSNATDTNYSDVLDGLMRRLRSKSAAGGGGGQRKFAAGTATALFQTLYGLVQCMPDLSEQDCDDCLEKAISSIPRFCNNRIGGRIIKLSCNIRYENYRFYDTAVVDSLSSSPPPAASPSNTSSSQGNADSPKATSSHEGKGSKSRTVIIVAASIGAFIAILILIICICFVVRKSKRDIGTDEPEAKDDDEIKPTESLQFNFSTIRLATDNFSIANKLGQGGFGSVYKGKLPNGQDIAVKRLSMDSGQGDSEFKNEVLLVAKLQHRNLVRLLGFSLEKRERLLVYEFLPNRSLDYLLFDSRERVVHLNWVMRYKIIGGIARGVLYLHEDSRLRIIHRDLKASNILLDEELNPKISDFGMAKLFVVDQTQSNTSRIVGTYGYMAPEYAMHGQFSVKSDVFSFGILVLEILSGKKNNSVFDVENAPDLLSFAWKNWREGTAFNLVDPILNNGSRNEIMRCIHIALLCVQENVADRPTMASVVLMLSSYSSSLPFPTRPPLLMNSSASSSEIHLRDQSSEATTRSTEYRGSNAIQHSVNDASITELYPR